MSTMKELAKDKVAYRQFMLNQFDQMKQEDSGQLVKVDVVQTKTVQKFIKREEELRKTFNTTSDQIHLFSGFSDVEKFIS